jgi:putative hydrolase of the HAD superfamily
MIDAGGWGVFIPHDLTWAIEHAEPPRKTARYAQISQLADLSEHIQNLIG